MTTLIVILDKLLSLIQTWMVKKENADAQTQRDQLEKNPSDWFTQHFNGGVSDNTNTEANKANTKD